MPLYELFLRRALFLWAGERRAGRCGLRGGIPRGLCFSAGERFAKRRLR